MSAPRAAACAALVALAALALTPVARAQAAPTNDVQAQNRSRVLFDRARRLTEQNQWEEACKLFQEAHDLHATGGTAIQLANCYERIKENDKALVYYHFILEHRDKERVEDRVVIAQDRIAALTPKPTVVAAPPPPQQPSFRSRVSLPVWIALGAGVAGVTTGAVLGGVALGEASSVKDACDGNVCPRAQESNVSAARAHGGASTAAFVVGFVGLATGAVLLAVAPSLPWAKTAKTARVVPTADGLAVRF